MNKRSISVAVILASVFAVFVLAAPHAAQAKSIADLQVKLSADINKDCALGVGYDPVMACYIQLLQGANGKPSYTIYLRNDLPAKLLPSVLLQQLAYFYLYDHSDQELRSIFNSPSAALTLYPIQHIAAGAFENWFYGGKVSAAQDAFFRQALLHP